MVTLFPKIQKQLDILNNYKTYSKIKSISKYFL
jgi:hypothetical protein